MKWRARKQNGRWPDGIPKPSIPTIGDAVPTGAAWLHEIKHDGYRLMVRRFGKSVQVITRGGYDWTARYPDRRGRAALVLKAFRAGRRGRSVMCNS